ncbi:MAG: hypothetical protein ACYDA3_00050 [Gaiellaceae bacterium]
MHLRAPSIAPGVKALVWALVFAAYAWLFLRGIQVSQATSVILAAVFGACVFLFVRVRGEI